MKLGDLFDWSEATVVAEPAQPPVAPEPLRLLHLPELRFVERLRVGMRFCLLAPAGDHPVKRVSSRRISSKRTAPLHHLLNGDVIAVVDKKLSSIPADITGVLIEEPGRRARWQAHRRLDDFEARFKATPLDVAADIEKSWREGFRFKTEIADENGRVAPSDEGLRPPQIGALHAIGAHWSIFATEPATVVMPTGTGKTETMICTVVNYRRGPTLVGVPSDALRWQTARKFETLGLLRKLGLVNEDMHNPIVGIVLKEPKTKDDLELFRGCNVVIGVMASIAKSTSASLLPDMAALIGTLFVDEAHHVAADTWSAFRKHFKNHRVVQFTATPFRQDGKLVDGRVIFGYPLAAAQKDGYFKPIKFVSIFQIDAEKADEEMAYEALQALRSDLDADRNHLLMARCARIPKGTHLLDLYQRLAPDLNPILVHSDMPEAEVSRLLDELRSGRSRIVVCVNMLGEGFDLPELKIAVLHDLHKSLPVLLQFTGRFTRSSGDRIGDATVVANIADPKVSAKLERLYSESADWNQLLSEASSNAAREHAELIEFLRNSTDFIPEENLEGLRISKSLLRPKFSTIAYRCQTFRPKAFHEALPDNTFVHAAWYNEPASLLYFVTRREDRTRWTRSKKIADRQWDLYVLFHDAEAGLLHVNSSDKDSLHETLAKAVGASERIYGEQVFRSLGGINRLIFNNIGLRKYGRRNMSFAMYTGADVRQALTQVETANATKSNLDGRGWEGGAVVAPGCSAKGRVWSKSQGTIPQWMKWCKPVGRKLLDPTIDVDQILQNLLVPTEIENEFPDEQILSVDWPTELLKTSDERIMLVKDDAAGVPMAHCEWQHDPASSTRTRIAFRLVSACGKLDDPFLLELDADRGYRFVGPERIRIKHGKMDRVLTEYLYDYPLLVRYVSLKELEGDLLFEQNAATPARIEERQLQAWDWRGVDIRVESTWKNGVERPRSVQSKVAAHYASDGFQIVFNDDDAGEAADLICLKETSDNIRLVLVHCKFSGKPDPGERVKDVVEVASQAVRSAAWRGSFERLHRHMIARAKLSGSGSASRNRFVKGSLPRLTEIAKATRMKPLELEIIIVQPGVKCSSVTEDQAIVLGSAATYLRQTVDVDLVVICST
ncbi:MAG TPA: DEAD/DEAH box helicase family protein [Bosea sp. (in: a-proteobacteria)]|uniref:DEAD/DEAH box helicase n=1 Tax=Bosea sp. (in: a-proteobacteria) TaxID=1871050 RepID=UPI002E102229|nr:DEAD/DEAH box helicase family protein [Bosea sp. (in: a-proteobacteria)]